MFLDVVLKSLCQVGFSRIEDEAAEPPQPKAYWGHITYPSIILLQPGGKAVVRLNYSYMHEDKV